MAAILPPLITLAFSINGKQWSVIFESERDVRQSTFRNRNKWHRRGEGRNSKLERLEEQFCKTGALLCLNSYGSYHSATMSMV